VARPKVKLHDDTSNWESLMAENPMLALSGRLRLFGSVPISLRPTSASALSHVAEVACVAKPDISGPRAAKSLRE
jgi:hypothetical protein